MSATEIPAGTQPPAATTPARSWPVLALAIAAGLAAGALTLAGQKLLAGSGGWFILVNSASPWLMVAFAAGAGAPGRWWTAAVAGAVTPGGAGGRLLRDRAAERASGGVVVGADLGHDRCGRRAAVRRRWRRMA